MANNRKTRSSEKSRSIHNSNQVRIIGGQWRGRKLGFPDIQGLRPTGDRMRETLFNWLTGYVEGASVVDLYAGSGALGLEALSRGAAQVSFIELNKHAAGSISTNLGMLNHPDNHKSSAYTVVHNQSALDFLKKVEPASCDILFLDPPFSADLHNRTLELIESSGLMTDSGLIYIEAPQNQPLTLPDGWSIYREKCSGQVLFMLCEKG